MENSRIVGVGHQVKGALEQGLGRVIGDAKLTGDGIAERAVGDAMNTAGDQGEILIGIDTDRIMGVGHQVKGALIQGFGSLVGNTKLEADGKAERQAGKAQNAVGSARDSAREASAKRDAAIGEIKSIAMPDREAKP